MQSTVTEQASDTYTYNRLDQLTSTSAGAQDSYDGWGNLTQITLGSSTTSYSYDAADRLTSVTLPGGTTASYAYDVAGRRVQQTVSSSVTNYLWDEASTYGDVVMESDGSGAIQASYVLGNDEVLAQTRGSTTSYYLYDGQGSVRLLTDGNGAITDRYTYDAFGNLLSSQGTTINPYRYTGQQFDSLTGLYDLRARYYDPTSGRFLSRDTASIDVSNPVEVNRYNYAEENPINIIDPSGHGEDEEQPILYSLVTALSKIPPKVIAAFIAGVLLYVLAVLYFAPTFAVLVGTNPQPQQGTPPVGYPTPTPDNLYIYRMGPDRLKTVALNRFVDCVSGLSFFLTPRSGENLRYKVQDLISAGFIVRPDAGGSPITDVRTGKSPPDPNDYPISAYPEQDPRIFQPNTFQNNGHVTVWLAFIPDWDAWYLQERSQKGVPGQQYQASPWTVALYNIPHQLVVAP